MTKFDDVFAPPRDAKEADVENFLRSMGLLTILGYTYIKTLSGGGTNFTAEYGNSDRRVVAKFFFSGPEGRGDRACDREIKMLKFMAKFSSDERNVAPEFIDEFSADNGMIVGFLMSFVEGENLWQVLETMAPGDMDSTLTTFYRIGWARHNSMRAAQVHKDLHPGNIIFEMSNAEWSEKIRKSSIDSSFVRILDFGSALIPMQFEFEDSFDTEWFLDAGRTFNGAFSCVAPEFFLRDFIATLKGSQAFDCWAMGQLLYRIYTGESLKIADSVGEYCELIYSKALDRLIFSQIYDKVDNAGLRFIISSMLKCRVAERVNLFSAIAYINCLRNKERDVIKMSESELRNFVYTQGCDREYGLPPHQRSNSGY
ncbi:hypothetical protein ACFOY5_11210 [Massilia aurea]|uniref:hypothetical protein n=1 Tax=Massilia aurea TaxID=373040 RepID=UPI0021622695|nr:hypothetical protein [Massilia aurea]MCS0709374.1 hypothetical protein [Massilia aurea]